MTAILRMIGRNSYSQGMLISQASNPDYMVARESADIIPTLCPKFYLDCICTDNSISIFFLHFEGHNEYLCKQLLNEWMPGQAKERVMLIRHGLQLISLRNAPQLKMLVMSKVGPYWSSLIMLISQVINRTNYWPWSTLSEFTIVNNISWYTGYFS